MIFIVLVSKFFSFAVLLFIIINHHQRSHLFGTPYLQISDLNLTLLFLNANLKITCFVVFLLSSFLRFNVTIVIRYCTLLYIVISVN